MAENKKAPRIYDVDVVRSLVQPGKDLAEFKKNNPHIFDHLGDKENAAYEELYKEFSPAPKAASPAPSGDAVKS